MNLDDDDSIFDDDMDRSRDIDRIQAFEDCKEDDLDCDEWLNPRGHHVENGASGVKDSEGSAFDPRRPDAERAEAKSGSENGLEEKATEKARSPQGVELIDSIIEGAFDKVEKLLESNPKCHKYTDGQGWSALMHAVEREDLEIFILLLSNGADISYINKQNGFNVMQLAKSTQMNLMCKRALRGFQLLDPKHFKNVTLDPKKYVAMAGQVEQERVRGTKSVVKGFIKMVWKDVQMVICGKEISLWKNRYGEDEVIAYLDLVDVDVFGTLTMENSFYVQTAGGHRIQFRVFSPMELAAWIFAIDHNTSKNPKRVDDITYCSKAAWEVHWAS